MNFCIYDVVTVSTTSISSAVSPYNPYTSESICRSVDLISCVMIRFLLIGLCMTQVFVLLQHLGYECDYTASRTFLPSGLSFNRLSQNTLYSLNTMSRTSVEVSIAPDVFRWLCGTSGWLAKDIAKRIEVPEDDVRSWYEGKT